MEPLEIAFAPKPKLTPELLLERAKEIKSGGHYNQEWLQYLYEVTTKKWTFYVLFVYTILPAFVSLFHLASFSYTIDSCQAWIPSDDSPYYDERLEIYYTIEELPELQCYTLNNNSTDITMGIFSDTLDEFSRYQCDGFWIMVQLQILTLIAFASQLFFIFSIQLRCRLNALILGLRARATDPMPIFTYYQMSRQVSMVIWIILSRLMLQVNNCRTQNEISIPLSDGSFSSVYIHYYLSIIGQDWWPTLIAQFSVYAVFLKLMYGYITSPWGSFSDVDVVLGKAQNLNINPAAAEYTIIGDKSMNVFYEYWKEYSSKENFDIILFAAFEDLKNENCVIKCEQTEQGAKLSGEEYFFLILKCIGSFLWISFFCIIPSMIATDGFLNTVGDILQSAR